MEIVYKQLHIFSYEIESTTLNGQSLKYVLDENRKLLLKSIPSIEEDAFLHALDIVSSQTPQLLKIVLKHVKVFGNSTKSLNTDDVLGNTLKDLFLNNIFIDIDEYLHNLESYKRQFDETEIDKFIDQIRQIRGK